MLAFLRSDQGAVYPVGPTTNIGRNPGNDLVLVEGSLSRDHARIELRGGRWFIEDLGSRNGTSVNGELLPFARARPLRPGDRVLLGTRVFTFGCSSDEDDVDRTDTIEVSEIVLKASFSPYQKQVLRWLAEPWLRGGEPASNAEIAARLGTPQAIEAVKAALRRVYAKAGLAASSSRAKRRALCEIARDHGLV
jgi:pSer/pThr/pTyr-binding forkhead associated (FHA) protein